MERSAGIEDLSRPWIYVVSPGRGDPSEVLEALLAAAEGGADLIQVREPDRSDASVVDLTGELVGRVSVPVLVNDRCDLAVAAGAAGVHLKSSGVPVHLARGLLGKGAIVARSTHTPAEADRAVREGVDFFVFGPVFATPSKRRYGDPRGTRELGEVCRSAGEVPVVAIGGVEASNAGECLAAGAAGVAVIRAALDRPDPAGAVRTLRESMEGQPGRNERRTEARAPARPETQHRKDHEG